MMYSGIDKRVRERDGLTVQFIEKKGFQSVYTSLSIDVGGNDRLIHTGGAKQPIASGAAHFLEHLVFNSRDQAFSKALSARGISANAVTKYEETVFYASAIGQAQYMVNALLQAVSEPCFNVTEIEREKAVILAELDMVENDPAYRLHETLINRLYSVHPVRDDIGGTREDVKGLSAVDLEAFHQTYYTAGHVQLTVAGDIDKGMRDDITQLFYQTFPVQDRLVHRPIVLDESLASGHVIDLDHDLELPQFAIGIKLDPAVWPDDPIERFLARNQLLFWLETYFGTISPHYDRMMVSGLIDDSFGFGLSYGSDFVTLLFSGHSRRPDEAAGITLDTLREACCQPPDQVMFDLVRQSAIGKLLKQHDSINRLGNMATGMLRKGIDVFLLPSLYAKITIPTVKSFASHLLDQTHCQTVILRRHKR